MIFLVGIKHRCSIGCCRDDIWLEYWEISFVLWLSGLARKKVDENGFLAIVFPSLLYIFSPLHLQEIHPYL